MTTQWISGVMQITSNIAKLEKEIEAYIVLMNNRRAHDLPIEIELAALEVRRSSLTLYRDNLKRLLSSARDVADWQVRDPDDPT